MSKSVKKIVYIGNMLSNNGFTPTSVETLGVRLKGHFIMVLGSSIVNPTLRSFHMFALIINNRKADILLIDTYSTLAFWYAVIASKIACVIGIPYIPILHGGNLPDRINQSPYMLRSLLKNAKAVVCPSGFLIHYMKTFYPRDYDLIPNYINIINYRFRLRTVSDNVRLLWVRSFHKIYNPKLAVDIVKGIKDRGLQVELTMVGPDKDGSMEITRNYAVEIGVWDDIQFTGRMTKPEWIKLANNFDVFINTTNADNTPVSVMEAMAMGMIVISTNVGGMPYLIENEKEGLLLPSNRATEFVENILKLKEDFVLAKSLSQNARSKAENWDWSVVEKKWLKLLNDEICV